MSDTQPHCPRIDNQNNEERNPAFYFTDYSSLYPTIKMYTDNSSYFMHNNVNIGIIGKQYNLDFVESTISSIKKKDFKISQIHAAGSIAQRWAKENNFDFVNYTSEWNRYGKAAESIRNIKIIEAVDILIVFLDRFSQKTNNTIIRAKKRLREENVFICPIS